MTRFASDAVLGYRESATRFTPGDALRLDEAYRLAHLPLVAPVHPDVIARMPGRDYEMGRRSEAFSLVAPLDAEALGASAAWHHLMTDLRNSPLNSKIAWDILPKRRARLHATLCGSLDADAITPAAATACRAIGPIRIAARGLFSGAINLGRLYLRLYPEERAEGPAFHAVQRAFGRPPTPLFLAGVFNLTDHLDAAETAWLAGLIADSWETTFAEITLDRLWVMGSRDDLVLDSRIVAEVPLA